MKQFRQNVLGSIISSCLLLCTAPGVLASEAADDVIDDNSVGGVAGYLLKRLNGPVIDSRNPDYVFYPASSIKILEHLSAMRLVEAGKMNLDTTNIEICNDQMNCGDGANSQSGCAILDNTLRNALTVMMVNSGNRTTNAVQEFVGRHEYLSMFNPAALGRQYMNDVGQNVIGYSASTQLNHKFACGNVSNNPANSATLSDFSLLYEAIGAREDIISLAGRLEMKNLMLDEDNGFFTGPLSGIIAQEASDLGKDLIAGQFRDEVRMIYKAGSLPTGYLSVAGIIQLPINNGTGKRIYTFSSFIEAADIVINGTQMAVSAEVLRPVIRSALQSWNQYTLPGPAYVGANDALGSLKAIVMEMGDDPKTRSLVEAAVSDMAFATKILSSPLPDNNAAQKHLVAAVGYLVDASGYEAEGNIAAATRKIVQVSSHLSDNTVAAARGESLNPDLESALRIIDASRTQAKARLLKGELLGAAQLYAQSTYDAVLLVGDSTGGGCTLYSEDATCPEHATDRIGF